MINYFFLNSFGVSVESRKPESFTIENLHTRVGFHPNGLIKTIDSNAAIGHPVPLDLGFVKYGTRANEDRSGAYLFLPDGKGNSVDFSSENTFVRVIRGPLRQESRAFREKIEHAVVLMDTKGSGAAAVHVENIVDISNTANYELAMRFSGNGSWLNNRGPSDEESEFYTDLNCYQMLRRVAFKKLPLQANVYPMPCAVMLEGQGLRLSVLSAQPLGAGSLSPGHLDIFLDRRLDQDDNRGLGEGVKVS